MAESLLITFPPTLAQYRQTVPGNHQGVFKDPKAARSPNTVPFMLRGLPLPHFLCSPLLLSLLSRTGGSFKATRACSSRAVQVLGSAGIAAVAAVMGGFPLPALSPQGQCREGETPCPSAAAVAVALPGELSSYAA